MDLFDDGGSITSKLRLNNDPANEVDLLEDPSNEDDDDRGETNSSDDKKKLIDEAGRDSEEESWAAEFLLDATPSEANNQQHKAWPTSKAVTIAALALVSFTMGLIVSVQAHSYPVKAEEKGSRFLGHVFVFGIFEFLIFLASPWFSKYMMTKSIKFLINAGILVTSSCSVLFGLAAVGTDKTAFFVTSLVLRLVQAFAEVAYILGAFSLLAKEISHQILLIVVAIGMATLFGIGVFVGEFFGPPMIKVGGYVVPFAVLGCILNLAVFTTLYLLPSPAAGGKWGDTKPKMVALLQIAPIYVSNLTLVGGACCFGFGFATFREHMQLFKLDFVRIGFIYAGNILVIVVANPIWAYICKKSGKTRIPSIFAAVFIVAAFALQGPAPFLPLHLTLPICIVAVVFQGIGIGGEVVCSCMGGLNEARNHGYPDNVETKNLHLALGCAGYTIGVLVGSSVGILMVNTTGYRMASLFIIIQQTLLVIMNICYACVSGNMEQPAVRNEVEPLIGNAENE